MRHSTPSLVLCSPEPGSQGQLVAAHPLPFCISLAVRLGPRCSHGPSPSTQVNVWGCLGSWWGVRGGLPGLSGLVFLSLTKLSHSSFSGPHAEALLSLFHSLPLGPLFHQSPFPQGPRAPRHASELLFTTLKPKQAAPELFLFTSSLDEKEKTLGPELELTQG